MKVDTTGAEVDDTATGANKVNVFESKRLPPPLHITHTPTTPVDGIRIFVVRDLPLFVGYIRVFGVQYPVGNVATSVTINSWFPDGVVTATLKVSPATYLSVPETRFVAPRDIVNIKPVVVVVFGIAPC